MSELYPIIEVERESGGDSEEMMGSKDKFWYLHPTEEEEYWLFKYPRFNTGEHWAEKIAARGCGPTGNFTCEGGIGDI